MKKNIGLLASALIIGLTGFGMGTEVMASTDNGTATTVSADGSKKVPGIRNRGRRQKARIKQGLKSGEITKDEAKDLHQSGKDIRNEVKDAKADGKVTKDERVQIHKDLNDRSKDIYEKKHNDDKR